MLSRKCSLTSDIGFVISGICATGCSIITGAISSLTVAMAGVGDGIRSRVAMLIGGGTDAATTGFSLGGLRRILGASEWLDAVKSSFFDKIVRLDS